MGIVSLCCSGDSGITVVWEGVALASSLQDFHLFTPHLSYFVPAIVQAGCEDEHTGNALALSSPGLKERPPFEELFSQYNTGSLNVRDETL